MSALPDAASVVVIGGGVMGASTAYHLAAAGVPDVVLLDRGPFAGGSTSRSAGGVRAQFSDPTNLALAVRSLGAFEDFARVPGAPIDLHQVGYLFCHTDEQAWQVAQRAVDEQRRGGAEAILLRPEEIARLSPAVVIDDLLGGTFHARDGYCSPEAVVMGYIAAARRHGARAFTGIDVHDVRVRDGQIVAVLTSAGEIRTDAVVCCAGAWSREVGQMAGVDLPVTPVRRQILVTEPLPERVLHQFPVQVPMTIDAATTLYFHREGPGLLLGMSYAGEEPGFREGYSDDWMPSLAEAMERRAPSLLDLGVAHRWAGYYERTPDDNALVGEAPHVSRFLYATGFSGHGFLMGPAIGEVMRDLWLHQEPVVDVGRLGVERFAAGMSVAELGIV